MKGKVLIILSAIFLLVGLGLGSYGMYKLDWDFMALDARDFKETVYEMAYTDSLPNKVVINTSHRVNIVKGDSIKLTYYEHKDYPTSIVVSSDGTLNIASSEYKWDWNMFKFKQFKIEYTLTLPDNVELIIDATNIDVNLEKLSFKKLDINAENIDLTIKDCIGESINIDSTNADVNIDNSTINEFVFDGTNLDIEGSGVAVISMNLECVNIEMNLTIEGLAQDYTVKVDAVTWDRDIREQIGSSADKCITIDTVNLSGYLKYSRT